MKKKELQKTVALSFFFFIRRADRLQHLLQQAPEQEGMVMLLRLERLAVVEMGLQQEQNLLPDHA